MSCIKVMVMVVLVHIVTPCMKEQGCLVPRSTKSKCDISRMAQQLGDVFTHVPLCPIPCEHPRAHSCVCTQCISGTYSFLSSHFQKSTVPFVRTVHRYISCLLSCQLEMSNSLGHKCVRVHTFVAPSSLDHTCIRWVTAVLDTVLYWQYRLLHSSMFGTRQAHTSSCMDCGGPAQPSPLEVLFCRIHTSSQMVRLAPHQHGPCGVAVIGGLGSLKRNSTSLMMVEPELITFAAVGPVFSLGCF